MSRPATEAPVRERCRAITSASRRCRNYAIDERGFCRIHAGPSIPTPTQSPDRRPPEALLDERLRGFIGFLRRRVLGDYQVDPFGFDRELTEQVLRPLAMAMYQRYWRGLL